MATGLRRKCERGRSQALDSGSETQDIVEHPPNSGGGEGVLFAVSRSLRAFLKKAAKSKKEKKKNCNTYAMCVVRLPALEMRVTKHRNTGPCYVRNIACSNLPEEFIWGRGNRR